MNTVGIKIISSPTPIPITSDISSVKVAPNILYMYKRPESAALQDLEEHNNNTILWISS